MPVGHCKGHRGAVGTRGQSSFGRSMGRPLRLEALEDRRLLAVLFRVNAGGPELAGSPMWTSDTATAPSIYNNAASGGNSGANSTTVAIDMSHPSLPAGTPMALFQSQRFDKPSGANLLWDFPVAPGQYEVRLYFAETNSSAFVVGGRQFDVAIEGATVLDNYDIFADVGSRRGVMKSFTVTADANIDIDFFRVKEDPTIRGIEVLSIDSPPPPPPMGEAAVKIEVFPTGSIHNSSTAKVDSFRIHNNSTGGREIASVTIDLSTSLLPDLVYDPDGTAGDVVGIPFTPNSGGAATEQLSHSFSGARDGGFDALTINFSDFDPGETFTFRVDIDPTSVKGSDPPGPAHSASISGLELSGAVVTVLFEDKTSLTGQLFALEEGADFYKVHSEVVLTEDLALPAPSIGLVGVDTPAIVQSASQTVRIAGPAGAPVRLLQTEVALHLDGVPGGGFDIDPYEGNKVVVVKDSTAVIGSGGFVDVPITLTDTLTAGGLTYLAAVIDVGARTGAMSNVVKVALRDLPPGSVGSSTSTSGPLLTGDYDADGDVDGGDFLTWQRALGSLVEPPGGGADGDGNGQVEGADLPPWQENFGALYDDPMGEAEPAELVVSSSRTSHAELPPLGAIDDVFSELRDASRFWFRGRTGRLRRLG